MLPDDLPLIRTLSRPALGPDGVIFVAESWPDVEHNLTRGRILRIDGSSTAAFTSDGGSHGTASGADSDPVLSPDGSWLVFRRSLPGESAQLWIMPTRGGEALRLTDHRLGADRPAFSPDGLALLYTAPVPAAGRYGTDPDTPPAAESPRRIDRLSYRLDDVGFVVDRPKQVFWLDLSALGDDTATPAPIQLTAEPGGATSPVFSHDGRVAHYVREAAPDSLHTEIAAVGTDSSAAVGRTVLAFPGHIESLAVAGPVLLFAGVEFEGADSAGRTTGLFVAEGYGFRRLTDPETVQVVPDAGAPFGHDDSVFFAVEDHGAVGVRGVSLGADATPLADLRSVIVGPRAVRGFAGAGDRIGAVMSDVKSISSLIERRLSGDDERVVHRSSPELAARLRRQLELTGTSPDGHPVHGFLVLPDGPGPHPVLLDVHGGPHAAYSWGFFDEAQVYAGAGYAVVLPNPRGSSGYGQAHGRAVVQRLGTVDVDDVLAVLDVALARPDCDNARVGVMGGSYGGFMTSWLASHHADRFVAGISERALNAWDSFLGSSDIGWRFAEAYVGTDRDALWSASPLAYADDIDIPLLLIHSEHDWRCPIEQAQRLFVALRLRDAPVEMVLFPGEGHELSRSGRPRHRRERFDVILDWWRRYLPVDPGGQPG